MRITGAVVVAMSLATVAATAGVAHAQGGPETPITATGGDVWGGSRARSGSGSGAAALADRHATAITAPAQGDRSASPPVIDGGRDRAMFGPPWRTATSWRRPPPIPR